MFRNYREDDFGLMWRVEPICQVLKEEYGVKISPSGYYDFKARPVSARRKRDEHLKPIISKIWEENYSCWGVQKTYKELLRKEEVVSRSAVERLMKDIGICGLSRNRRVHTTYAGKNATSVKDLVNRNFTSDAPNRLWVADFTYVSTWEEMCYVAFITDVFARKIIGWQVASSMNQKLVADAFKMAVYTRQREGYHDFSDLIHHNDRGSQYTADDFLELLARYGIHASIGSVGDSYDNALAETMHGGYKTELIYNPAKGPWKNLEYLTIETARWVKWHNSSNITKYCNWHTPDEIEEMLYTTGEDRRKCPQKLRA